MNQMLHIVKRWKLITVLFYMWWYRCVPPVHVLLQGAQFILSAHNVKVPGFVVMSSVYEKLID